MPVGQRFGAGYRRNTRQGGQALVFALFSSLLVILALFAMFSMGERAIEKIRMQNIADSAAYSSAVAEARDYNFSAYTNRAMIANQVSVAQFVGLTSWLRNMSAFANNNDPANIGRDLYQMMLEFGGSPVASIYMDLLSVFGKGVGLFDDGGVGATFMKAMVTTLDGLITVYGKSQEVYHDSVMLTVAETLGAIGKLGALMDSIFGTGSTFGDWFTTAQNVFNPNNNIIAANDPKVSLSTGGLGYLAYHLYKWSKFTGLMDPNTSNGDGANADRFAQVTMNSLDDFSRDRSTKPAWGFNFFYAPPLTYIDPTRFIPYQMGPLFLPVIHRGGTELKLTGPGGSAATPPAPSGATGRDCNGNPVTVTPATGATYQSTSPAISVDFFSNLPNPPPSPACPGTTGTAKKEVHTETDPISKLPVTITGRNYVWNGSAWIDPKTMTNTQGNPAVTTTPQANGNRGAAGSMSKQTWTALDASSWAGIDIIWFTIPIIFIPIPLPIPFAPPWMPLSHGAAQSGKALQNPTVLDDGNNFGDNAPDAYGSAFSNWATAIPARMRQAKSDPAGATLDWGGLGGLTKYMDVSDVSADNLAGPPLVVEVEKKDSDMLQSPGSGRLATQSGQAKMRSLSKSQVYFSRPTDIVLFKRSDNKAELGSLYNPYWQPRLMPNNFLEQYLSMEMQLNLPGI